MKALLCAYGDAGLDALRALVGRGHTVLLVCSPLRLPPWFVRYHIIPYHIRAAQA
jgi:hypothetical protein